jgi:hypothetical protein
MSMASAQSVASKQSAAATQHAAVAPAADRPPGRTASPISGQLLGLQRTTGNAAVTHMLQGQRPPPSVQPAQAGWKDARAAHGVWNVGKTEVTGIRRYPLQLTGVGMKGAWLKPGGASAHLTSESAAHRAIALVPEHLSETDKVTVLLHFHGYADKPGRPYAGWREHTEDTIHPERTHTVRDVAQDRIEQQMHAAGDNQILGLLPVGGEESQFSSEKDAYNTFSGAAYLDAAIEKLVEVGALKHKVDIAGVILSAHSGGGLTVSSMLDATNAARAGQKPVGRRSTSGARIAEVALFEAIVNDGDYRKVKAWVEGEMNALANLLAGNRPVADKHAEIDKAPRFRAYYGSSYVNFHLELRKAIDHWYDQSFTGSEKAGQRRTNKEVLGPFYSQFVPLFQVIHVGGVGHEEIVRGHALSDKDAADAGSLTDALKAFRHPSASQIPGLGTSAKSAPAKTPAKAKHAPAGEAGPAKKKISDAPKARPKGGTSTPATGASSDTVVTFGPNAKPEAVAAPSLAILKDVISAAGLREAQISSTARSPADQARVMYQNLVKVGVEAQKKLYEPAGDKVIDVFVELRKQGKSPKEIQDGMRDKIIELGPSNVSRHCGDYHVLNVFDVAPSSLGGSKAREAFNAAAKAEEGKRVSKYIPHPPDPGYHFEIKPSGGVGSHATGGGSAGTPAHDEPKLHTDVPKATGGRADKDSSSAAKAALSPARRWKASDATAEYSVSAEEAAFIKTQTPKERAADQAKLKAGKDRLKELRKRAKAGPLGDADKAELSELAALEARVKKASLVLHKKDVEEVLRAAGFSVHDWYSEIVNVTFLGIPLRVHKLLAERLDRAQASLLADAKVNPKKVDADTLRGQLGMDPSASSLRAPAPAVGGKRLSLHTFGLAVDLSYAGNPFIGNESSEAATVIKRATSLVLNSPVDVTGEGLSTKEAFAVLKGASDALATYFSYRSKDKKDALEAKLKDRVARRGEPTDYAGWLSQIKADHKRLAGRGDFSGHSDPAKGFLEFQESVVMALAAAGLTWGGTYNGPKDLMHFDLRNGNPAAIVDKERKSDTPDI